MTPPGNAGRPVKTAQYDPDTSSIENWEAADPLDFGWFGYASIDLIEQYRDAGPASHQRTAYLRAMMQKDVEQMIGAGTILALGIRLPLNPDPVPEILPSILFKSVSIGIDWEMGTVMALGQSFGDVRLCGALRLDTSALSVSAPAPPVKRGRPSLDVELERAFVIIEEREAHFLKWSQEKQIHALRDEMPKQNPGLFPRVGPGRSTVARFLKRRRAAVSLIP